MLIMGLRTLPQMQRSWDFSLLLGTEVLFLALYTKAHRLPTYHLAWEERTITFAN